MLATVSLLLAVAFLAYILLARNVRRQATRLLWRSGSQAKRPAANDFLAPADELAMAIDDALSNADDRILQERRRADEALKGLSELSHDIRTPLAAAKGHLQLAGRHAMDRSAREHVAAAEARIDATAAMFEQLLELARASDPDRTYQRDVIPLLPLLLSTLSNHEREFEESGLEPFVSFAHEDARVIGDRQALERILENLAVNAIRYGTSGISCIQSEDDGSVVLRLSNEVSDRDLPDTDALFERFYRASSRERMPGSGLGLPIAKALAEHMGMGLDAKLEGSVITFRLRMPAVSSASSS